MASIQFYDAGLDLLKDWETNTFTWMLIKSSTFNVANINVSDLSPGSNEVTVAGYARQNVDAPVRTVDGTAHTIKYTCQDANFGTLATGETVLAIVLYEFVTNDADSLLVGWTDLSPIDTNDFDPMVITITNGLVATLDEV